MDKKIMYADVKRVATLPYNWNKYNNKTFLISGGTGFVGSFLCDVITYRNAHFNQNIKIISLSRRGGINNETVSYLKQDITKTFSYNDKVDYIIHLASNTHPQQYADDPIGTITTNIYGCDNLLKLSVEKKSKFLLASSVEIYGQGTEIPMDETYCGYIDCNQARAGYNESKRLSEALLQSYRQQYGINAIVARLSRIFGPDKKKDTKALAQFMDKAVAGEDIVLKSKGNQRFSYAYVADAVSAILFLLLEGKDGEVYNVADDDDGLTLGQYAEFMANLAGTRVIYDTEDNPAASKSTYALMDCSKIKSLGWEPLYTVQEGFRRTYSILKCSKK